MEIKIFTRDSRYQIIVWQNIHFRVLQIDKDMVVLVDRVLVSNRAWASSRKVFSTDQTGINGM